MLCKQDPNLWYGIGILYDRYGSFDHAEEAFTAVLKMDAKFEKANEIYFRLGIIYKQQQKFEQSLKVRARHPLCPTPCDLCLHHRLFALATDLGRFSPPLFCRAVFPVHLEQPAASARPRGHPLPNRPCPRTQKRRTPPLFVP